ncbi:class I SAM-dependent methyltransferase [Clostridium oceanicum]|uniref:Methyltransferase n=1 Tax=Clostridium oceanicum TaxID=1543 RepID=A0ABP3UMK7_9CLOT
MNQFPKVDKGLEKLSEMIYAPMYTKILFAGIELDIFSQLEELKTYKEISEKLELHSSNTRYLLDALTSIDLLEKSEGFYKNKEIASKYLVKSSNLFIGTYIRMLSSTSGFDDIDIVKLTKEGPISESDDKEAVEESYELYGDYTQMIKTGQKVGRANEIADLVSSLPEFNNFNKMLDLGGGPGLIAMAITKRHHGIQSVVFDTPEVSKIAEESIKEYGLEERVKVLSGDYLNDSIGEGYDFILASGTLNFAKHDLDSVIKKIYDALNPKGVFMCISEGLINEKTKPKEMVVGWLPSFLKGYDFSLEQGEVSDAILRNGFENVYKRTFNSVMGEMDVDIARK